MNCARRGGYAVRRPGGAPQTLELADGGRAGDVVLRVWRYGAIGGTLRNEHDEPLMSTRVASLRVDFVAGHRRYRPGPTAMTDDRGVFRISGLVAGEYTVFVPFAAVTVPLDVQAAYDEASAGGQLSRNTLERSMPGVDTMTLNGSGFRIGDLLLVRSSNGYGADGPIGPAFDAPPPDADGRLRVYPFTFYPGVQSLAEASTFTIDADEERSGIDLQVHLVPAVRVSGRVTAPDGPAAMVGVRLIPRGAADAADESALESATTVTKASGDFTFLGVPAGQYVLKAARVPNTSRPPIATSVMVGATTTYSIVQDQNLPPLPLPDTPTLSATVPIAIGDRDLTDVKVSLASGPRVTGHVEFDGAAPHLTGDQLVRASITLDPVDGRSFIGASSKGQFDADGQFKTLGLLPGRYVLRVGGNLAPWALASATIGGRDVSDMPIAIESTDVNGVVITLTDRQTSVTGTVRDAAGASDINASVLLFPADRTRWTDAGASPRRMRSARVAAAGTFSFSGLPAGDYLIVAVDDRVTANWTDPKRLAVCAAVASRVTVAPGDHRVVDLRTEVIR